MFLYIGGETSGESRFSNLQTGIIQILMEATGGLGVILENRYYGESWPFESSSTDELRFLTTEQSKFFHSFFLHVVFDSLRNSPSWFLNLNEASRADDLQQSRIMNTSPNMPPSRVSMAA